MFLPGFYGKGRAQSFPVVRATATDGGTSPYAHTFPSGTVAGDLVIIGLRTQTTPTTPTGWTRIHNVGTPTNDVRTSIYYRVIDGSEGGVVTVTTPGGFTEFSILHRIDTYQGVPECTSTSGGTSTSVNPPSHTPTTGSDLYLWLAFGWNTFGGITVAAPAGYSNAIGNGAFVVSERQLQASSEDPPTYTASSGSTWAAATVSIRGTLA